MDTPEASERADPMTRDKMSQSPKTRNDHFSALPPELRAVVYEYYFSYENPHKPRTPNASHSNFSTHQTKALPKIEATSNNSKPKRKFKSILARKLPLLWASKAILDEALPVFYKCHTFRVHVPYWKESETWETRGWQYDYIKIGPKKRARSKLEHIETLAPAGRFITKVEIIEYASVGTHVWDECSIPGLQNLFYDFPNLRFLRLKVKVWPGTYWGRNVSVSANAGSLAEIWQSLLECLEVCVVYYGDEDIWFRETIAPASCWVQEMPAIPGGENDFQMRSVWSLRRSSIPQDVLKQLGGKVDEMA